MKKLHLIAIAAATIMFAACANKSDKATETEAETTEQTVEFYNHHDINGARVFVPKGWKIDSKNAKGVHLNRMEKPYRDASLDIVSYGSGSSAPYVEETAKAVSSTYTAAEDLTLGKLTYKHFIKQLEDSIQRHDLWADYPDGQGFLQVTINGYNPDDADIQAIFNEMQFAQ